MKKLSIVLIVLGLFSISAYAYAQVVSTDRPCWSAPVPWRADPSNTTQGNDLVTVQSVAGVSTQVQISVDHNSPAAKISNCGNTSGTTTLSPGSSAICVTDNPQRPITISSDDSTRQAVGTYQIRTP